MKKKTDKRKKIEEFLLKIAIDIAKRGEGALFIVGNKLKYSRLMKQKFNKFSLFTKGSEKILRSLAVIDGAIIINEKGEVLEYGAMIKNTSPLRGYGTRHAAAISASKNNNTSILCSEEERKVKIFKNGKYVMQIDALEKNIEKSVPRIASIMESIGVGTLGTIGVATLVPTLGIALIPGILVFGGSYFAIRAAVNKIFKK